MRRPRPVKVGIQEVRTDKAAGLIYARLRWTHDGKPATEVLGWVTREEAEHAAKRIESQLFLGQPPNASLQKSSAPTVTELLDEYVDDIDRREVGCAVYRRNIENRSVPLTFHLGRLQVDALTIRDLEDYVAARRKEKCGIKQKRPLRRATVQHEVTILRRVIELTRKWGRHSATWPGSPSFKGWPDDARPARRLSEAELAKLLAVPTLRPELRRQIEFMAWCPRRPVAIFTVRRQDVTRALDPDYDGNDLVYWQKDKGGLSRGWGPLLFEAREILQAHLRDTIGPPDEFVFRSVMGHPYRPQLLNADLAILCRRAKVAKVTCYDLRKMAAVRAYAAVQKSIRATMKFTGHTNPNTLVKRYLFEEEDLITAAVQGRKSRRSGTDAGTVEEKRR